jgi:acetyltransferase-like isoleucine patch superfamily enzyme
MDDDLSPFYSDTELLAAGFSSVGRKVQVSRLVKFYGILGSIGSYVRIDDYCILKGRVQIGSFVHIAAFCMISGSSGQVILGDFSSTAARTTIFTGTDDHFAAGLIGPTNPREFQVTKTGDVILEEGAAVGAHCVILPNTVMEPHSTLGALCIGVGRYPAGRAHVTGAGRPRSLKERDLKLLRERAAETLRRLNAGEL